MTEETPIEENPLLSILMDTIGELHILARIYKNDLPENTLIILTTRAQFLAAMCHDEMVLRGFKPDIQVKDRMVFSPQFFMEHATKNSFILQTLRDDANNHNEAAATDVANPVEG